jgi:hypothetical protein
VAHRRATRLLAALLLAALAAPSISSGADSRGIGRRNGSYVLPCTGIHFSASYLAEAAPGQGPGFAFRIENHTAHEIRLEQPVPSSTHWYAHVGARWLWRASAGSGGALVNALNPHGPMFAYRSAAPPDDPARLIVPAHGFQQWTETIVNNPAIAYNPSCAQCNYPGENDYQAVFAYAYLPAPGEDTAELLPCGLRSDPVPMPPHSAALPGSKN